MKTRLESIDALRGLDMLCICGLCSLAAGVSDALMGVPGSGLAAHMEHVDWIGLHFYDLIFPLFIFLAGVSTPFSLASARAKGVADRTTVLRYLRRLLVLCALGAVYNRFYGLPGQRWTSVLERLGVIWFVSAMLLMYVKSVRVRLAICAALLVGYWALLYFVPAPDAVAGMDVFTRECNLSGWIDRKFLPGTFICEKGHPLYDHEGLLSTPASITIGVCGTLAGELVRRVDFTGRKKALVLLCAALAAGAVTLAWLPWCPIVRRIWTPTYITVSTAFSFAAFALFYWAIDVRGWRMWAFPFRVVGMNAIFIYMFEQVVPLGRIMRTAFGGFLSYLPAIWQPSAVGVLVLAAHWILIYWLYRKNIFIKI